MAMHPIHSGKNGKQDGVFVCVYPSVRFKDTHLPEQLTTLPPVIRTSRYSSK